MLFCAAKKRGIDVNHSKSVKLKKFTFNKHRQMCTYASEGLAWRRHTHFEPVFRLFSYSFYSFIGLWLLLLVRRFAAVVAAVFLTLASYFHASLSFSNLSANINIYFITRCEILRASTSLYVILMGSHKKFLPRKRDINVSGLRILCALFLSNIMRCPVNVNLFTCNIYSLNHKQTAYFRWNTAKSIQNGHAWTMEFRWKSKVIITQI